MIRSIIASLLLIVVMGCTNQAIQNLPDYTGAPVDRMLLEIGEAIGDPAFRYRDGEEEYIAFRAPDIGYYDGFCHVIYTISDDEIAAVDMVGAECTMKTTLIGLPTVNARAETLKDQRVGGLLKSFGIPDAWELDEDGSGELFYFFGADRQNAGTVPVSGNVGIGVGFVTKCEATVTMAHGTVEEVETKGGQCWATRF